MAKKRIELPVDVVTAARMRLANIFANGVPVYLCTSGGKDSIVLCDLVYQLVKQGRVDPALLTVLFIDEEAMHDDVIDIVHDWRRKFRMEGVRFQWWCIEVRHFNCFNQLSQDESFICWDSTAADRWCRQPPVFALRNHPKLRPREDTYQDFLARLCTDGIRLVGTRVAESIQRLLGFTNDMTRPEERLMMPVYDWKDTDVWRYVAEHNLDFPETYMRMYQAGMGRRQMRISQFFSIDTAKMLVRLSEYSPGLMERVERREPNAYLAALYWDTEMFKSAGGRGKHRTPDRGKDWRRLVMARLSDPEQHASTEGRRTANLLRRYIVRKGAMWMQPADWRKAYEILIGGDPKNRSIRALTAREKLEYENDTV